MTPSESKTLIVSAAKQVLQPLGYRKAGNTFQMPSLNLIHLIEVQASRDNTAADSKFTVNVGIFVPELVYPDIRDITKPSMLRAHWRQRIGFLSPEKRDLWWKVLSQAQAETAAQEIAYRIQKFALPALAEISNIDALLALWLSGVSPGLSEHERKEYLALLDKAFGGKTL